MIRRVLISDDLIDNLFLKKNNFFLGENQLS